MKSKFLKNFAILLCIVSTIFLYGCKVETVSQHNDSQKETTVFSSAEVLTPSVQEQTAGDSSQPAAAVSSVTRTQGQNNSKTTPGKNNGKVTPAVTSSAAKQTQVTSVQEQESKEITVTIKIECTRAVNNPDLQANVTLPSNGVLLGSRKVTLEEGATVFDVLKKACDAAGIAYSYTGKPKLKNVYIYGIGGLYEKDCGAQSGWKYKVNGVAASAGCSGYKLKNTDSVLWYYTTAISG